MESKCCVDGYKFLPLSAHLLVSVCEGPSLLGRHPLCLLSCTAQWRSPRNRTLPHDSQCPCNYNQLISCDSCVKRSGLLSMNQDRFVSCLPLYHCHVIYHSNECSWIDTQSTWTPFFKLKLGHFMKFRRLRSFK